MGAGVAWRLCRQEIGQEVLTPPRPGMEEVPLEEPETF